MSVLNFTFRFNSYQIAFNINKNQGNNRLIIDNEFEYVEKIREAAEKQFHFMAKTF
ncbi:hypothetical protein [Alkaliphilus pronyensis]|uniref:hypothetical protein n=1 Tax=Alkaliphilus pronyensis TaxID=1482732 RepID=UPI0018657419|nr:hypothetical protein [Alkaliphilus pronyensis]